MSRKGNFNEQLRAKHLIEYSKISKAFGVDLNKLHLELDLEYIKSIQQIIGQKPSLKDKSVLFLNHPIFVYHEKNILLFLNRIFKHCDSCHILHRYSGLNIKLENVRYISKQDIFKSTYDYVIIYKGLSFLSENISRIKSDNFFVLFLNSDVLVMEKDPEILNRIQKSNKKITYFNLFKSTLHHIYNPSEPLIKFKASINWPPSLDLFFKVPQNFLFDYLFMGGGARDYQFLYENQDLFQGKKVIITHCDSAVHHPDKDNPNFDCSYDRKYLGLLNKIDNFICLNRIDEQYYCKLLLYTRITICLFRNILSTHSTCISDAIWYGKPVITTKVEATEHLKDYALFAKNAKDVKRFLKKLDDPEFYKKITRKTINYGRKEFDIYKILRLIE